MISSCDRHLQLTSALTRNPVPVGACVRSLRAKGQPEPATHLTRWGRTDTVLTDRRPSGRTVQNSTL